MMPLSRTEAIAEPRQTPRERWITGRAASGTVAGPAVWFVVSNVAYVGAQWAALMALAKLGDPAVLGRVGLALAISTPVVLITGFALRTYQATDVLRRYAFAEYLNLRLAANFVAAGVIAAAAALAGLEPAAVAILVPIAAAKLAEATCEVCYGLAQRHDRMRFVALSRMTRGGLGFAALVAIVALGGSLAAGCWALAATWTIYLFAVDLPVSATLEPVFMRPRLATLARLARETAPLGAVTGVFSVTQNVPRYLLQLSQGTAAVGYFTALSSCIPALGQLAGAVSQAAAPRLGWNAAADGRRYRALVLRLVAAGLAALVVLTSGAALLGHRFLTLAYTPEYAAYHVTFVVIVAVGALGMVNEMLFMALVAARRLGLQLGIQCVGLAVTAIACAALVPHFGVGGAAVGLGIGAGATAAVSAQLVLARRGTR